MIDESKVGLEEAKDTDSSELHSDSQSVRHKFEAAKHVAETAESSVTKWLNAKKESHVSVVQGWNGECESRKLEHQATSAEDDAEAGIYLAEASIVRAVVATYEAIDARRAAGLSLTLLFRFNDEGLIDLVRAESRAQLVAGVVTHAPWQCRFWNYATRDGMRVPLDGEAAWVSPQGLKPYFRGHITQLRYEFSQ
ncbi:MAG: hypothetical protein H7Y89_08960 [Steroidobacteraceae bacterium]|nr:hypothetical protein [Steroidobacteraceae bacterium]